MVDIVAQFFSIIGADQTPPANMAELIPYLLYVFVGLVLVCAVFKIFEQIAITFINFRRTV